MRLVGCKLNRELEVVDKMSTKVVDVGARVDEDERT